MNILIIGDSWGVPNYYGGLGDPPETHTEYRLKELGYTVYNCAQNGLSNVDSINIAKELLLGNSVNLEPKFSIDYRVKNPPRKISNTVRIDWVIWFQTEFFRGPYINSAMKIDDAIAYTAELEYSYAKEFLRTLGNVKLALIGGQCPVLIPLLYKYLTPDFLIQDWKSEILEQKLPEVFTLSNLKWLSNSSDDIEYKLSLAEKHKIVLDAMFTSSSFPDNCHPGSEPHKQLVCRLHEVFQNGDVAQW